METQVFCSPQSQAHFDGTANRPRKSELALGCSAENLARRFGDIVSDVEGIDLRFRVAYLAAVENGYRVH
ncbi:hypothetical protein CPC08DRAFT_715156 [Agrocybe pediades]|nr:hypothetical protein CPC08DRAFT_715156 [Agrocybe pediades]